MPKTDSITMLDDKSIKNILEAIGETLVESVQQELLAIKLDKSDLYDSVNYEIKDNNIILNIADYYVYVETGRKPLAKKVPVKVLLKWMKKKGISTNNNAVWAIREAIYKNGIRPRPFLDKAQDRVSGILDTYTQVLGQEILDTYTKKVLNIV